MMKLFSYIILVYVLFTTATTQPTGVYCPDNWHYYNNSCFFVSTEETDQPTARSRCQEMNSDLASISNQAEMDFVESISNYLESKEYWFGLYKIHRNGRATKWYDDNPSTYRNWAEGEPNNLPTVTICVRYTEDGFKDYTCSEDFYFTCKKSAHFYETTTYLTKTSSSVSNTRSTSTIASSENHGRSTINASTQSRTDTAASMEDEGAAAAADVVNVVGVSVGVSLAATLLLLVLILTTLLLCRRRRRSKQAKQSSAVEHSATRCVPTVGENSTVNQYETLHHAEYEDVNDYVSCTSSVVTSQSISGNGQLKTAPSAPVYAKVNKPAAAAAGSGDVITSAGDVTDLTVIDNDLYEVEGLSEGHCNAGSNDYDCTLVDNDLYR